MKKSSPPFKYDLFTHEGLTWETVQLACPVCGHWLYRTVSGIPSPANPIWLRCAHGSCENAAADAGQSSPTSLEDAFAKLCESAEREEIAKAKWAEDHQPYEPEDARYAMADEWHDKRAWRIYFPVRMTDGRKTEG